MNNSWLQKINFETIIDIGANEGQFANNFLKLFPDAKFYCFEPLPVPFQKLTEHFKDKDNFNFYNFALGNEVGEKKMFRNEFSPSSSILPMEKSHKEAFVFTEKEFVEKIKIERLDNIFKKIKIKKPFLIKIDVQGFEMEVMRGGSETISAAFMIILETSFLRLYANSPLFDDIYEFLKCMGFDYQGSYEQLERPQDGRILQQDSIFIKNKDYRIDASSVQQLLKSIRIQLDLTTTELSLTKENLNLIKKEYDLAKTQLYFKEIELSSTKDRLDSRVEELTRIYYSRVWRLVMYSQKALSFLIPKESVRRKVVAFLYNHSKKSVKYVFKIKGKIFGLFLRCKDYFIKLQPKKERKINEKSKKIVFVSHSYHSKTKSTGFLISYLKKFLDVEVILDESWLGKPFPDLSFVDESYLGVIFFQLLPPKKVIQNIRNDNIIYFPMYDHSGGWGLEYWHDYKTLKIINFSRTLHNKLKKWGFESMYVQYFPEPVEFAPGNKDEVFFWQRLTHININTITKLFQENNFRIHLHTAVDPGQEFITPNKGIEDKFKITYSDWFENKAEVLEIIKQKGIYVAPREYEGIGISFLEAMAMGKAVVAIDNPTMNEYIKDGENGYLFDLNNPKEIVLSNLEEVQKNTYKYMKDGHKRWIIDRGKIINYIRK